MRSADSSRAGSEEEEASGQDIGSGSVRSSIQSVTSSGSQKSTERHGRYSFKYIASQLAKDLAPSHVLYELDEAAIVENINEIERAVRRLQVENEVFYKFFIDNDPVALEDMDAFFKRAEQMSSGRRSSMLSKKRQSLASVSRFAREAIHIPKININQKNELVTKDMDQLHVVHVETLKKLQHLKEKLVVYLEEKTIRRQELEDSINAFGEFQECNKQMSVEKFSRFMNEWSKRSRLTADKLRLKFSSLKVQFQKLSTILAHKQLIGENLQEIDFEKLKFENLHLNEKLETKNILLLELKKMSGAGNLKLSQHKKLLQEKSVQKQTIQEGIKILETNIMKSDNAIMRLYTELEEVKQKYDKMKDRVETCRAPEIMEYVTAKVTLDNLKKAFKVWTRKKIIKQATLNIEVSEMKKLLHCKQTHPCWFE